MQGLQQARYRVLARGLWPAAIVLLIITAGPALFLLVTSLTPLTPVRPETALDFSRPAANFQQAVADARFRNSLVVQGKLSIVTVAGQLGVGLGLALLLNANSRVIKWVRSGFLIPMVLPPIVVAIAWKILFTPDTSPVARLVELLGGSFGAPITNPDLALWAIALADTWEWFPFTLLMCLAALQMMPVEPIEAAHIDGAGVWQTFRFIVLPYLRSTLVVVAIFRLIESVKAFPLIYILTGGGPGSVTEVTNYYAFIQAFNFSYWGYASALATLLMSFVLLISALMARKARDESAT
jgi:multiple sugar transport system permease protein